MACVSELTEQTTKKSQKEIKKKSVIKKVTTVANKLRMLKTKSRKSVRTDEPLQQK